MANLDELIQKLSEKSKALTYDSGRWDSTQLAKKTKELTELLPEILNGIIDAIPEGGGTAEPLVIDANIDLAPGTARAQVTAEEYAAITNALNTGRLVFVTSEGYGYLQVFSNSGNAPFFLVSDTQDEAPRCCYIQIQE